MADDLLHRFVIASSAMQMALMELEAHFPPEKWPASVHRASADLMAAQKAYLSTPEAPGDAH